MKARISVSIYSALAMCGILFTQSCTKDEVKNESTEGKSGLQEIMVSMPQEGAESRISLTDEGNKISAKWKEKDVIYLVPKSATSADAENIYEYVCNEGNTNTALFTLSESENGIGLPEGEFYAFYGVKEIGYDNGITYTLESPKNMYSKGNKDIIALENSHAMKAESEYRGNTLSSIAFESLMSIIEVKADISEYTRPQVMTMVTENPEGFITRQTFMASTGNAVGEPTRSGELKIDYYDAKSATPTYGYFMIIPQDLASQTIQIALNGILKELGYNVIALDFINFLKSNHYNFLDLVINAVEDDNIPLAESLVNDIVNILVIENVEKDNELEQVNKLPFNANDLMVITVVKKLAAYTIAVTEKSPKKFRGVFVNRMQNYCLDTLECLLEANFTRMDAIEKKIKRAELQKEAIVKLKLLGYVSMVAENSGCILKKQYKQISIQLSEAINLTVAWKKSDDERWKKRN